MEDLELTSDFWCGRRVLLTGHTGFKGSWLLLILQAMGARVTGLSKEPDTNPSMFRQIGGDMLCDHHIADIRDPLAVSKIVLNAQPEVIMHLAAQPLVRRSYVDPIETFATNVLGTAHLLEAARKVDDRISARVRSRGCGHAHVHPRGWHGWRGRSIRRI